MKYYFMSYVYNSGSYGSYAYKGDEHPIAKVNNWNKKFENRTTVLLFWKELTPEEYTYMEVETP